MKFTLEGIFKNCSDGTEQFYSIRGINCCDEFLYICDYGYQRISVFDLNLKYIKDFGHGKIKSPIDVSIHSDRIYILSQTRSSIYCYTKDCTFQKVIELKGENKPMTLALFMVIDIKGNFLISDESNQQIRIFSPQGILKHIIGQGQFYFLNGLTLDNSNNIICVNNGTGSDCFQKCQCQPPLGINIFHRKYDPIHSSCF